MRRIGLIAVLVLLAAAGGYLASARFLTQAGAHSPEAGRMDAPAEPEAAHNFTLTTLAGDTLSLDGLRGQWVLVNFWATWCPPCVKEMPYLQRLSAERELAVLGVNLKESPADVSEFVTGYGISFPILMNPDDITLLMYQARSLPRTFVIAPDGTIALRVVGELAPETFDNWLDERVPRR